MSTNLSHKDANRPVLGFLRFEVHPIILSFFKQVIQDFCGQQHL